MAGPKCAPHSTLPQQVVRGIRAEKSWGRLSLPKQALHSEYAKDGVAGYQCSMRGGKEGASSSAIGQCGFILAYRLYPLCCLLLVLVRQP